MTVKSVAAFGKTYVITPIGAPVDAIVVATLGGGELVSLHNLLASNLGRSAVKRFSDNSKGAARTWALLLAFDEASAEDLASFTPAPPVPPAAQLTPGDQKQITDEAAARKPSEALLDAAAAAGAKAQAQAALRANPPASADPAKDAQMPTLRKTVKATTLDPKKKVYSRKAGTKQAVLVDLLSRPQGATFGELYDGLAQTGKPWRGVTIRSGLAWDMNHVAGYGVRSEHFNGEEFKAQGRTYEAQRLGVGTEGYDPELKLAVYHLTYPAGMDGPLDHIGKATK